MEANGPSVISPQAAAIGLLEGLWHMTAVNAPQGNLGRFTNDEIAEYVGWYASADLLVDILVSERWVDQCDIHRLVVHNWHKHCPQYIKGNLSKHNKKFAIYGPIEEAERVPRCHNYNDFRKRILERDQHECQYCGMKADQVDHIKEQRAGGDHSDDNVVACCRLCNINLIGESVDYKLLKQRAHKQRALSKVVPTNVPPNLTKPNLTQSEKKRVLRNTPKENDPGVGDPLCATVDWIMFRWNEIEGVKHINEDPPLETKKRIAARIREHPKKAWWDDKFFSRVGASNYLRGKSNVAFRATLDWACGPKSMTKILNDLYLTDLYPTTQRKVDGADALLGEGASE